MKITEFCLDNRTTTLVLTAFMIVGGLFAYQKGWGFIEADPKYREEILEIYADVMKQQG